MYALKYCQAYLSPNRRMTTVSRVERGEFLPHRDNGCISCRQLGLCLGNQQLIESKLVRCPGASDLDWLNELVD